MSPHRDDHLDLCAARALGGLSPADAAVLDAHLAGGCDVCERGLRAFTAAAEQLARAVPQRRAPAALRARVLEAVRAGGAPALPPDMPADTVRRLPARERPSYAVWAWAAAAGLLVVASV
jgi:hypothetical protein